MKKLPSVLDLKYYRQKNKDLHFMTDDQLNIHFKNFGIQEGRIGSSAAIRKPFLKFVHSEKSILEIGPFCKPSITGKQVKYFDVLDQEGLVKRAKKIGYDSIVAPKIDFVSTEADLSIIKETFSAVFSSHAIEHQPDFIQHLQKVSAILEPGGLYYLIIPDKRYCFDALIAKTTIADVIDAYQCRNVVHSLKSVIEHRALTTHNDSFRHWNNDHYFDSIKTRTSNAIKEYEMSKGGYLDVHAWQFTPLNFAKIIQELFDLDFINIKPHCVYHTPNGRIEFTAVLKKILK